MELYAWQKELLNKFIKDGGLAVQAPTGAGKGIMGAKLIGTLYQSCYINTLVVCPPHLISDWTNKLMDEGISQDAIVELSKKQKGYQQGKINIISYNKMVLYANELFKTVPMNTIVVYDEAHKLKNWKSKSARTALKLTNLANTRNFLISATLITKGNLDLFTIAQLSNKVFRAKYKTFWVFQQTGAVKVQRIFLSNRTVDKPMYIHDRPLKELVLKSIKFPTIKMDTPIEYIDIPIPVTKEVDKIIKRLGKENLAEELEQKMGELDMKQIQDYLHTIQNNHPKLLQLANNFYYEIGDGEPKFFKYNDKLAMVDSIVKTEAEANHKGILFYFYNAEYKKLVEKYQGKSNVYFFKRGVDVTKQINDFENGNYDLFIVNIASLGEGVRFKKTHYIIEFTTVLDYGRVIQGEGRLRYSGRKDGYKVYRLYNSSRHLQGFFRGVNNVKKKINELNKELQEFSK